MSSAAASPEGPEDETLVDCEAMDESEVEEEPHHHRAEDDYFRPIKKLCMQAHQEPEHTVKPLTSFFIKDILNHKPPASAVARRSSSTPVSGAIVRPWDCCPPAVAAAAVGAVGGGGNRRRPRSADDDSRSEKSESDSPESPANAANSSPLDALFEMTSKAFEGLEANEKIADGSRDHLNLFSNRSQPKKKRKSRTAFTNHQIFELEKRFLYQKYLSPADRDEIAQSLGLTNAQVITWFQNRRAKLKRDMEELKKDVDASKLILHKNIMNNIQDLSVLKGKDVGLLAKDVALHLATRTAD